MTYDAVHLLALLTTALVLAPALAHALTMPNKISLPRTDYFIVQQIYRGWNQFAYLLLVQFASLCLLAAMAWGASQPPWPALMAIGCLLAAQAIFWIYTYPANVATRNWTVVPENWEQLRWQWEMSHATGAVFQFAGMCALLVGAVIA
jgi:hypothetical protein